MFYERYFDNHRREFSLAHLLAFCPERNGTSTFIIIALFYNLYKFVQNSVTFFHIYLRDGDKYRKTQRRLSVDKLKGYCPGFLWTCLKLPLYVCLHIKCDETFISFSCVLSCVCALYLKWKKKMYVFFYVHEWWFSFCYIVFFSAKRSILFAYFCPDLNLCSATTPRKKQRQQKNTENSKTKAKKKYSTQNACVIYYNLHHI